MKHDHEKPHRAESPDGKTGCNHPLAVVIDPTDDEIKEVEKMLAECPYCSQWSPGDGPIMAVISSYEKSRNEDPKELA
jgi:hypothetical protein